MAIKFNNIHATRQVAYIVGELQSPQTTVYTTATKTFTLDNPNAFSTALGDWFGWAVSISGNYAIVSAYQEDDANGNSSSKAYIFELS